jgi:hypothetical protein
MLKTQLKKDPITLSISLAAGAIGWVTDADSSGSCGREEWALPMFRFLFVLLL